MDRQVIPFSSRREFDAQLAACLARAQSRLRLFDRDFALWELGSTATDALLRRFLADHGSIELVVHEQRHLERHAPRFLRLLQDYGHAIACRTTPRRLANLTDSFCIADEAHIVRRFHADHLRGEAVFDSAPDTAVSAERFAAIWAESGPGLRSTTIGL